AEARRQRTRRRAELPRARLPGGGPGRGVGARRGAVSANGPGMRAEDVFKRFGRREVLKGVSLEVRRGEVVCIISLSGSGKATFIRRIHRLEKIDSGRMEGNGHLIGCRERSG